VRPPAHPFRVVTRTVRLTGDVDAVERRARESLKKLGTERAAALLVGDAEDLLGYDGPDLWKRLQRLKAEGLYDKIGISVRGHHDAPGLARRFQPDLMQMPASLLDQRLVRSGAIAEVAGLGVEVQLREALPEPLKAAGPRLSKIRRMVAEAGADLLQAALAFALQQSQASTVVVGVGSAAELRAVLAAAGAPPPALEWGALALDEMLPPEARSWISV
jgi:aryl-alcohol dehydrogenase-like predicted oxidoreductase